MNRRSLLQSAAALMVPCAKPSSLPAMPALGTKPIHSAADFRKAFAAHLDAQRTFHGAHDAPPRKSTRETWDAYHATRRGLDNARCQARRRLLDMTLENHGYEGDTDGTMRAAVHIDLGDIMFVAGADPAEELEEYPPTILTIVPRSPEMCKLMAELPTTSDRDEDNEDDEPWSLDFDMTRFPADEPVPA
jgi:hypothetical protein